MAQQTISRKSGTHEVPAVLLSDAAASAGGVTGMGLTPIVPSISAPSNGADASIKSYSRGKYRGVFRDIMTKLRAGKTLFFSNQELSNIMYVMNLYKKHVIMYEKFLTLAKRLGFDMAVEIIRLENESELVVTYRELQEKKRLMNENISYYLAVKAQKMLKYSSRYKSQFGPSWKYYGLIPYFRAQVINDPNLYWAHYKTVSRMLSDFAVIKDNQHRRWLLRRQEEEDYYRDMREEDERDEEDRRWRASRGFEYDDADHVMELTQNGYRRAWYGGYRYGGGYDSDDDTYDIW